MRTKEEIFGKLDEVTYYMRAYRDFKFFVETNFNITLEDKQVELVNEIEKHNYVAIMAFTGAGKCLHDGTKVIMFDGTIKKVEDVKEGDILMGDDSTPRNILKTSKGYGKMYKITPVKGEPYYVNDAHILTLKYTNLKQKTIEKYSNKIIDISVKDYISQKKCFKHWLKGFHVPVNFKEKEVLIDPYFLGIWLGNGHSNAQTLTLSSRETIEYAIEYGKRIGLTHSFKKEKSACVGVNLVNAKGVDNILLNNLRKYKLIGNKHIPIEYKANSRKARLELLAGLIDTDGNNSKNCIDFCFKGKEFSEDVAFLCRSLGFMVSFKECKKTIKSIGFTGTYYRLIVSGELSEIPTRVKRKQFHKRMQKKDALVTGITVEESPDANWSGFIIDGNGRFLLEDFTVTHNTLLLAELYPIWKMCFNYGFKALIVSNSLDQSTKTLRRLKDRMKESEFTATLIPESKEKWSETEIITSNQCHVFCKPLTPNIKGVHVHYLLADEVAEYTDKDLFKGAVLTRVTANDNTKIAAISTPVSEIDMIHELMENSVFKKIVILAEEKVSGVRVPTCPDRFPIEKLDNIKKLIGEYAYGREYLCDCKATADRGVFDVNGILSGFDSNLGFNNSYLESSMRFIGADFATSATGDYTVFTVIEVIGAKAIIKNIFRTRGIINYEDSLEELVKIFNPSMVIYDQTNVGAIAVNNLMTKGVPLMGQGFTPRERMDLLNNLRRIISNKQIVFPRNPEAEEVTDMLFNELTAFVEELTPSKMTTYKSTAAHDDLAISLSLACKFVPIASVVDEEKSVKEEQKYNPNEMWIM